MEIIIMIIVIIALRVSKVHMSINDAGSRMRSYDPVTKTYYDSRGYMYMDGHIGKVYRYCHPKTHHDIIEDKHGLIRDVTQERINNDKTFKERFDNGEYELPVKPIVYNDKYEWYDLRRVEHEHAYYSRHWLDGHILYDPITDRPCIKVWGCPDTNPKYLEFHPVFYHCQVLMDAETGQMLRMFDPQWHEGFVMKFVEEFNQQQAKILRRNREQHGYYDLGLFFLLEGSVPKEKQMNYSVITMVSDDEKRFFKWREKYIMPLTEDMFLHNAPRPDIKPEREWDYE